MMTDETTVPEIYGNWTGPLDMVVDYDVIPLKSNGSLHYAILDTVTVLSATILSREKLE